MNTTGTDFAHDKHDWYGKYHAPGRFPICLYYGSKFSIQCIILTLIAEPISHMTACQITQISRNQCHWFIAERKIDVRDANSFISQPEKHWISQEDNVTLSPPANVNLGHLESPIRIRLPVSWIWRVSFFQIQQKIALVVVGAASFMDSTHA